MGRKGVWVKKKKEKKRNKKCNCIHWTLKCFDGFWEPHYIYIGMCH